MKARIEEYSSKIKDVEDTLEKIEEEVKTTAIRLIPGSYKWEVEVEDGKIWLIAKTEKFAFRSENLDELCRTLGFPEFTIASDPKNQQIKLIFGEWKNE